MLDFPPMSIIIPSAILTFTHTSIIIIGKIIASRLEKDRRVRDAGARFAPPL